MENYNEILKQQTDAFFTNDQNQNVIWKKWKNVDIGISKEQAIHCEKICHEFMNDLDAGKKLMDYEKLGKLIGEYLNSQK